MDTNHTKQRLVAVGCSGSKYRTSGVLPAKRRYKGSYWVWKRRYADVCGDDWRVISAKYNLLHPETEIPYYDCSVSDLEDGEEKGSKDASAGDTLDEWAAAVRSGLVEWVEQASQTENHTELQVLLGLQYREPLAHRGVFDPFKDNPNVTVVFPFQEFPEAKGGLFQQIGWMSDAVSAATEDATGRESSQTAITDYEF